jgi:hypothetical protein
MAAGTGDVLYVNTREILAVEIRSENGGVVLVLKDGKAVPVADDYRVVIDRLHHRPSTGLIADHRLDVNVGEGTHRHHG